MEDKDLSSKQLAKDLAELFGDILEENGEERVHLEEEVIDNWAPVDVDPEWEYKLP